MSKVKMLVDRLFIQQKDSNIFFSHIEDEGLKVEEHYVLDDNTDGSNLILLDKEEKESLLDYLLNEEKPKNKKTITLSEEKLQKLTKMYHDYAIESVWNVRDAGVATGIKFLAMELGIWEEIEKGYARIRRET